MNKIKMSLPLKAFVVLMALNLVTTGFFVLMASSQDTKHAVAMFGLSIFSMIFVAFMIYVKEVLIGDYWLKISSVIKFIYWGAFVGNSLNFIQHFMDAFIFN